MLNKRHHYTSIGITNCLSHVKRHCNLPTNQVTTKNLLYIKNHTFELPTIPQNDRCICYGDSFTLSNIGRCLPQRCSGSGQDFCGGPGEAVVYQTGKKTSTLASESFLN